MSGHGGPQLDRLLPPDRPLILSDHLGSNGGGAEPRFHRAALSGTVSPEDSPARQLPARPLRLHQLDPALEIHLSWKATRKPTK
jgi:hypothetical protein